jgi:hypothetical protein
MNVGDRLVFSNGIIVLAMLAIGFLIVFGGHTHALLPLYTVGVFIAFTLAQAGMVRKSLKAKPVPILTLSITGLGTLVTAVVLCVILYGKFVVPQTLFGIPWFHEGAWMALLLMGLIIWMFYGIAGHYKHVKEQLARVPPEAFKPLKHTVIVLVPGSVHHGVVTALNYARSLSPDAIAVHVDSAGTGSPELKHNWEKFGADMPLIILDSPYRELVGPLMRYLDSAERVRDDDLITVILPEFVPARWWHSFLHNAAGWLLRFRLFFRRDIVIVSIRYYLDK